MRVKNGVLALIAVVTPTLAAAQTSPQAQQPAPTAQPQQQAPAPQQAAPPGQQSTSPATSAAPASSGPVTGYGYGYAKKAPSAATPTNLRVRKGAPIATLPGFEQLPDGSSRLFVELSAQVPVEERHAQGSLTYVLKGAQITHRNNANALVTVHFNTPVSRARLVPSGQDLLFVIDLRAANIAPAQKITAKGQGAIFTVDFPKGDYLPRDSQSDAPQQN